MREAMLYEKTIENRVHCFLCAHQCRITNGHYGFCGVRKNIDGTLFTYTYQRLIAGNVDPVEKKPLYHFLPGSKSYSIAAPGCNFRCGFCQNWQISQITQIEENGKYDETIPELVVKQAVNANCKSISFTYTEPTIYFEYAFDIAQIAKSHDLATIFVTNGYMTEKAIQKVSPYLDACNIDLKAFTDDFYKNNCKSHLKPVLQSIENIKKAGIWLEITTLLIPGENDSEQELESIAEFIAGIDVNIPWHVSRFFPQYHFQDFTPTPITSIKRAVEAGHKSGLRYVYAGNVSGRSDTVCYNCREVLIERDGYRVGRKNINDNGSCPKCGKKIEGRWFQSI